MTIVEQLKAKRTEGMKSKDKDSLEIVRYLLGRLEQEKQQPVSDDKAVEVMRSFWKSIKAEEKLGRPTTVTPTQMAFMESFFPAYATQNEIRIALEEGCDIGAIRQASQNQAMGLAMKTFKSYFKEKKLDGEDVREVLSRFRPEEPGATP